MKNLQIILKGLIVAGIIFLTAFLTSCSSDDSSSSPSFFIPPSEASFRALIDTAVDSRMQTVTFNAEDGLYFTSEKGAHLAIAPNGLIYQGNLVTGEVELEFIEIYESGDMVVTNKPVMGIRPNGDLAMLISGGEFFINATQNGQQLDLHSNLSMVVPADLTGGVDQDMILWNGIIDEDGNLTWEEDMPDGDGAGNGNIFIEEGSYYFSGGFGWTNVDRFYSDPRPKTTLQVKVPEGFDKTNTNINLKYVGEPNALARLDTYDSATRIFSEHYGEIPIGLEMHVIFVSESSGQHRYAIQSVTVGANDIYTFEMSDTAVASDAELVAIINALP